MVYEDVMPNSNKWLLKAVTIVAVGEEGVLQVLDLSRSDPIWKFPGGGVERYETIEESAVRELHEESGVVVSEKNLILVDTEERGYKEPHLHYFFIVSISGTFKDCGLLDYGPVTGEKTRIISKDTQIKNIGLSTQRKILERLAEIVK